jgi:hypothetical protein
MKSKQLKIAGIVTVVSYLLVICLYCIHQGNKSHPDARQAESYVHQLSDNKYDSVRNDMLISERTAIKIADRLFTEKYGLWHTFLWKPFDIYLFNNYWFVYASVSKSALDNGPMMIINYNTGETRFKP